MGDEVRSSATGSFAPQTAGVVFDLAKEADALAVLKSVHRSALDAGTKNALRDAVFEYRQSFDQAALTHACELFADVGMSVVGCAGGEEEAEIELPSMAAAAAPTHSSRFRTGRRSAFGKGTQSTLRSVASEEASPVKIKIRTEPIPEEVATPPAPPAASPQAVAEEPLPAPAAPVSPPVPEPVVPAPVAAEAPPAQAAAHSGVRPADRINEIKKVVNDRVGNPVNLIDAHNEIGREYMSALLEAMKKHNGGQAAEVSAAMARLEAAFAAVQSVLDAPPPVAVPAVAETSEVSVEQQPLSAPELSARPVSAAPQPVVISAPTPAAPEIPVTPFTPVKPNLHQEAASMMPVAESAQKREPLLQEDTSLSAPETVTQPKANSSDAAAAKLGTDSLSGNRVVSVAKAKQVEELMHKQFLEAAVREEQVKQTAEEKMDPIMVSEVTAGLRQLLSEWSLFKSSGLFGTGPSGIDHPMYKKIANLPMQAVVAGRFEGSTAQMRQNISDYMNGWRYEEGVVFDYGESFEHYLRRVIRHILDKKKKSPPKAA